MVTLTPGLGPIMLTEYAGGDSTPVQIINTDVTAGRVYLGSDSSVSSSNGVPLDPGTALPWTTPGQIWAIADPTAAGPIGITVTAAIGDWTPSPAAIAAQVAQELLLTGIPNVFTETDLGNPEMNTPIDVSGYASLTMTLVQGSGGAETIPFYFSNDPNGFGVPIAADVLTANPLFGVPVQARYLIINGTAGIDIVDLVGTNRPSALGRPQSLGYSSSGFHATSGVINMVAGNSYGLGLTDGDYFDGPGFAMFIITGSTALGQINAECSYQLRMIAHTGEMITAPGSVRTVYKEIGIPPNFTQFQFLCTTSGSAAVGVHAFPAY